MNPATDWVHTSPINRPALTFRDDRVLLIPKERAAVSLRDQVSFTIAMWVNFDGYSLDTIQALYTEYFSTNSVRLSYRIYDESSVRVLGVRANFGSGFFTYVSIPTASLPAAGTWWHLVARRDGGSWELWANGAQVAQNSDTTSAFPSTGSLTNDYHIGRLEGIRPMSALASDIAMWHRALSPAEIPLLANPSDPSLGGLLVPEIKIWAIPTVTAATIALTGTITTATETDIVNGGKTIILTVTGDTWVASGATFDAQRQNIIDGIDSAQAEATGWDAEVKAKMAVTEVVRTSDTVVTITLAAQAAYDITATETITATVPATALTGATQIVASPTFQITAVSATTTRRYSLALTGVG
jgi:hypothetical protein